MQPVQTPGVLDERPLPRNRHREEERVQARVVEPLADEPPRGEEQPFLRLGNARELLGGRAPLPASHPPAEDHEVAYERLQPFGE